MRQYQKADDICRIKKRREYSKGTLHKKMASIMHYMQRIKEGRLKQLISELLWMYGYVRRYWLLIGFYVEGVKFSVSMGKNLL